MDAADDENAGTALYAPFQTILYMAPPVVDGKIPKNVYGNLDVYVPSMVPPGGAHISHPETARAARILGIDYADAVTGFLFKGRHGTAIINGAVVAAEYREAVDEVVKAFEDERAQVEEERRSLAALKMWKRFLAALRIRERIEGYDIEGEHDKAMKDETEEAEDEDEDNEGGGFLPDRDAHEIAQPTARTEAIQYVSNLGDEDEDQSGGFCMSEVDKEEIDVPQASDHFRDRVHDDDNDDDTGGFQLDIDERGARIEISRGDHQETSQEDINPAVHMSPEHYLQETLDQDGGFLPDDSDAKQDSPPANRAMKSSTPSSSMLKSRGSINPHGSPQSEEQSREAFPDLPAGELEEARILQQLYESQGSGHPPTSKEDVPVSASAPKTPADPPLQEKTAGFERVTSSHQIEAYPSDEPIADKDSAPDSSEEDKGSLLSHDPDDEDADPEWLA